MGARGQHKGGPHLEQLSACSRKQKVMGRQYTGCSSHPDNRRHAVEVRL